MSAAHPLRDAIGLALAHVDNNFERQAEILEPYAFAGQELHLLVALLALIPLERDGDELEALLWVQALAGAGHRPDR